MNGSPFVLSLASVFAGLTALLVIGAVVSGSPVALFAAVPLGLTSYFMYYHGSGRLARSVHRRAAAERREAERGGFGAGPRDRRGARTRFEREARSAGGRTGRRTGPQSGARGRSRAPGPSSGPTRAEAREVLGVGVRADEAEVKRAYRERVKEVHPDRGGDEAEFRRVTAAYDRLTDS